VKTFVTNNLSLWHYEHQLPRRPSQSGRRQGLFVRRLPNMYLTEEDSSEMRAAKKRPTSLRDEVLAALDVSVAGYKELLYFHDKIHTNTLIFVEAINRQFPTKTGSHWRFGLRCPLSQDGKELTSYVAQRQHEVMRNPSVLANVEALWNLFPKDHRGFLAKSTHARIFYDFFKILAFDVVDETLRTDLVRKDWELRADGRLSIDGARFCVSMRCTVDVWCETNDPQEAIDFLGFLLSLAKRTLLTGDDELQRGHGLLSGGAGGDADGQHQSGSGMEAAELQGVSTVALRDGRKQVEDLMVRTLGRRNVGLHSADDVLRRRQQLEESRNSNSPLKRLRMSGRNDDASLNASTTSTAASSRRKQPTHHATTTFATSSLVSFVVALTTPGAVPKFDVKSSLAKRMEATETIVATRGDANGMMAAAEASMSSAMMAPPTPSVLSKSRADLSMSKSGRSGLDESGRPGKDDSFSSRGTYASMKCLVPRKVKTTLKPNMESEFLDRYAALDLRLPSSVAGGGPPPLPSRSTQSNTYDPPSMATLGRGVVTSSEHGTNQERELGGGFDPLSTTVRDRETRSNDGPRGMPRVNAKFLDSFGADVRRGGGSDEDRRDERSAAAQDNTDEGGRPRRGVEEVHGLGMELYGSTSGTPPPSAHLGEDTNSANDDDDDDASFERGGCGNDSLVLLDSVPASPSGTPRNASMSSFRGKMRSGAASPRGASFVRRALRRGNESGSPLRVVDGDDSDDSVDEALALVERHFSRRQSMFRDERRKSRQASEALRAALARPVAITNTVTGGPQDDPSSSPSSTAPLASPGTIASSRTSSPSGGIAGGSYAAPIAMGRLARTAAVSFRVRPDEARMVLPSATIASNATAVNGAATSSELVMADELSLVGSQSHSNVAKAPPPLMRPQQLKTGTGSFMFGAAVSTENPADQMMSSLTFSASAQPQELGSVVVVDSFAAGGGGGPVSNVGNRRRSIAAGGARQGSSSTLRRRNTLLSFVTTEIDDEATFQKNMVTFVQELTDNMTLEEQEAHRQASAFEDADAAHYAPLSELAIPVTLIKGLARWRGPMHCTGQNDLYHWFDPRLYGVVSSVSIASLRRFASPFVFAFLLDPWAQRFGEEQQPRLHSPTASIAPRMDDAPRMDAIDSPSAGTQGAASSVPQLQLRWYYERLPSTDPSDEVLSGDEDEGGRFADSRNYSNNSAVFHSASMDVADWVMFGEEHSASLTQLWIDGLGHAVPLLPPPSHFLSRDEDDGDEARKSVPSFPEPAYGFDYSPIRDGKRCRMVLSADFTTWRCGYDAVPIEDEDIGGGGVVAASPLPLNRRRSSFALALSAERAPHGGERSRDGRTGKKRHLIRGHRICAHWAYVWEYQNPTATAWCPFPMSAQVQLTNWLQSAKWADEHVGWASGSQAPPAWTAVSVVDKLLGLHKYREHCLSLLEDYSTTSTDDTSSTHSPPPTDAVNLHGGGDVKAARKYLAMTSWSGSKHISVPVRYQVLYFSKEFSVQPLRLEEEWRPTSAPEAAAASTLRRGHHPDVNSQRSTSPAIISPAQRLQESLMAAAAVAARGATSKSSTSPTAALRASTTQSPTTRRHLSNNVDDEDDMLHSSIHHTTLGCSGNALPRRGGRSPQTSPVTLENISFVEESVRHALLRGGESEDGGDSRSRPGSASMSHSSHCFPVNYRGISVPASHHIVLPSSAPSSEPPHVLSPPTVQRDLGGRAQTLVSSTVLSSSNLPMQSRRFPLRCPEAALQAEPPCVRSTYASDMFQKAQRLLGSKVEESDSSVRSLDPPRAMTVPLLSHQQHTTQHPRTTPITGGDGDLSRALLPPPAQPAVYQGTPSCSGDAALFGKKAFRGAMPVRRGLHSAMERRRSLTSSATTVHPASRSPQHQRHVASAYCRNKAELARFQSQGEPASRALLTPSASATTMPQSTHAIGDVSVGDYATRCLAGSNKRLLLSGGDRSTKKQ
jgi:hypothetical protein